MTVRVLDLKHLGYVIQIARVLIRPSGTVRVTRVPKPAHLMFRSLPLARVQPVPQGRTRSLAPQSIAVLLLLLRRVRTSCVQVKCQMQPRAMCFAETQTTTRTQASKSLWMGVRILPTFARASVAPKKVALFRPLRYPPPTRAPPLLYHPVSQNQRK